MKIFYFCLCTFGFSESSGGFGATSEAFIFSLNNNEELVPFVSKVKPGLTGKAIHGFHIMVHVLAMMSSLTSLTGTQEHVWAITTLFHLQCRTTKQSWPGLCTSHLMRWRYFILTHPAKCRLTQTIIFITINSENEALHLM